MIKTLITAVTAMFIMMASAKANWSDFYDWYSNNATSEEKADFNSDYANNNADNLSFQDFGSQWWTINMPIQNDWSEFLDWYSNDATAEEKADFTTDYNSSDNSSFQVYAAKWWNENIPDTKTITIEGSAEEFEVNNLGTGTPDTMSYTVDFTTQDVADAHADGWTGKGFTIKGEANGWKYDGGSLFTPDKIHQSKKHDRLMKEALADYWDVHYGMVSTNNKAAAKAQLLQKFKHHKKQLKKIGAAGSAYLDIFESDNIAPGATFVAPDSGVYTAKLYKDGKANAFVLFDEIKHNGSNPGKKAARAFNANEAAKGALVWHKFNHLSSDSLEELLEMTSDVEDVANWDPNGVFFDGDSYMNVSILRKHYLQ